MLDLRHNRLPEERKLPLWGIPLPVGGIAVDAGPSEPEGRALLDSFAPAGDSRAGSEGRRRRT